MKEAFSTALGMSFISMLTMEAAMECVDLYFTGGSLQMPPIYATPLVLSAGFFSPLPYNYFRLKKHGKSCH